MATNLAYQPDYDTSENYNLGEQRFTFQIDESQRPWVMTIKPEPRTVELDTGLRADIRLTMPLTPYSKIPARLASLVETIKSFEALDANWDSYAARPLDDRAVRAAMELIVDAERTCCAPDNLVPLSSGGLGLRWTSENVELEIDIDPDKTCSAVFEGVGEELDLPRGSSLSKAVDFIARYRRSR
jgi:hypothetical protein